MLIVAALIIHKLSWAFGGYDAHTLLWCTMVQCIVQCIDSSFLLMQNPGSKGDCSSSWAPLGHMEGLDGISGSGIQSQLGAVSV